MESARKWGVLIEDFEWRKNEMKSLSVETKWQERDFMRVWGEIIRSLNWREGTKVLLWERQRGVRATEVLEKKSKMGGGGGGGGTTCFKM